MKVSFTPFPNSLMDPFEKTSEFSTSYNCIAWACEDETRWYWPNPSSIYYWPSDIPREETLEAFIQLFENLGYLQCKNGDAENGFLKIAIYTNNKGIPTHAARQLNNGYWTSKLGKDIDVSHSLFSMDNGAYGQVTVFMRKKL